MSTNSSTYVNIWGKYLNIYHVCKASCVATQRALIEQANISKLLILKSYPTNFLKPSINDVVSKGGEGYPEGDLVDKLASCWTLYLLKKCQYNKKAAF